LVAALWRGKMSMEIVVRSQKKTQLIDITSKLHRQIADAGVTDGICMIYVPHTTAAVTINESADPAVETDILNTLNKVIPWDDHFQHQEGI